MVKLRQDVWDLPSSEFFGCLNFRLSAVQMNVPRHQPNWTCWLRQVFTDFFSTEDHWNSWHHDRSCFNLRSWLYDAVWTCAACHMNKPPLKYCFSINSWWFAITFEWIWLVYQCGSSSTGQVSHWRNHSAITDFLVYANSIHRFLSCQTHTHTHTWKNTNFDETLGTCADLPPWAPLGTFPLAWSALGRTRGGVELAALVLRNSPGACAVQSGTKPGSSLTTNLSQAKGKAQGSICWEGSGKVSEI